MQLLGKVGAGISLLLFPLALPTVPAPAPATVRACHIVVGEHAPDLELYAATELRKYLYEIYGIDAPLSRSVRPEAGLPLLVGSPATNSAISHMAGPKVWPKVTDQGLVLKRLQSPLPAQLIGGGSAAATLRAVYELLERLGMCFLLEKDILPARPALFPPAELNIVMEPELRFRSYRGVNDLATSLVFYGMEDYRRLIDQLAKLKFNVFYVQIYPYQPFVHYEFRGQKKTTGFLHYGWKLPVHEGTIGKELFGGRQEMTNPDFSSIRSVLEHTLRPDWGVRLSYMGSKGTQLTYSVNLNTPVASTEPFSQATLPYPNFNNIIYGQNGGNDYLQSFEIAVMHPWATGLWFQASYTYRYARSDVGFEGFSTAVATPQVDYAYDRSRDKGPYEPFPTSDFVTNWVYEAPVGRGRRFDPGRHGVAGKILSGFLGNWAASGVLTIRGGLPFSIFYSNQDPAQINQFTGRPDQIAGCDVYQNQSIYRWFNPACFKVPAPGALGNFVRNLLIGLAGWTVVLNSYKDFPIPYLGESARLRLGANIHNLFNHPVFGFTEQGGGVRDITNPARAASPVCRMRASHLAI